jgi:hypothetical protein
LPAYAPELNPVECAWSYLKMNPLANRPAFDTDWLAAMTRRSTRALQRNEPLPDRVTDQAHIIETGTDSYRFRRTLQKRRKKD